MKINNSSLNLSTYSRSLQNLFKGKLPKAAPTQVDKVEDVSSHGLKSNHRVSYTYNKDLKRNIAHVIDNSTGEVVRKRISDAEVDRMLRTKRLMELGDER
ncbi:flagellar protein FlaG [Proteinivorax hydrogeniformans]|uniref:Flagellar protein FlaG n=1 Tax=Proteinivorax hydrogeniformans TaxID=1826727 RepID=A0AAU8HUX7_9FIRM